MNILITGCSTGIGYHAAHHLKSLGYRVFVTARRSEDVDQLNADGFKVYQLDITEYSKVDAMFDDIIKLTNGRLDALFNNAAYGQPGAIEDLSVDVLKEQFETNVFAWHYITNKSLSIMRRQGYGRIIQNSSVLGLVAMPFRGAYNASKFALEGLTDTLRLELMGSKIHLSLIEPGPIDTCFRKNALAKFHKNIDVENSRFSKTYQIQIDRLSKDIANQFTLPPAAVTKQLIKALTSKKPKARYYVTFPTYLFGFLKRILSARLLDKLLVKG